MFPVIRTISLISFISLTSLSNALPSSPSAGDAPALDKIRGRAPSPTGIPQASALVSSAYSAFPSNPIGYATALIVNGLVDGQDLEAFLDANLSEDNSYDNNNPIDPNPAIYPTCGSSDPPYVQAESTLRSAIHIPSGFTYGDVPPVILIPGTGNYGGQTFGGNFLKLLSGSSYGDPVWLNIPGAQLADEQANVEFVAYAINYISSISGHKNVSLITWSAGGLQARWVTKYWPSTREIVSDHIAISPDYHGTEIAYLICPKFPILPCDPSVLQQSYDSNFIAALRANGGDSAYVPTTNVYSVFDEIVQPQEGSGASAYSSDAHHVGVSNTEVQQACPGELGGSLYTHEGVLYNPVAVALAIDALTHDGPGELSRIDLATLCPLFLAEGLDLTDFLLTEESLVIAAANLLFYGQKQLLEPPLRSYATAT